MIPVVATAHGKQVMELLLEALYTDSLSICNLDVSVLFLTHTAATYFAMTSARKACEDAILQLLCEANVVCVLEWARHAPDGRWVTGQAMRWLRNGFKQYSQDKTVKCRASGAGHVLVSAV